MPIDPSPRPACVTTFCWSLVSSQALSAAVGLLHLARDLAVDAGDSVKKPRRVHICRPAEVDMRRCLNHRYSSVRFRGRAVDEAVFSWRIT